MNNQLVHLTYGLISLVNYKHVDNTLKEILVDVFFELIVNSLPKKCDSDLKKTDDSVE